MHALAFAPKSPSLPILGIANNSLELDDVEARQFPPWSRALCSALPKRFTYLHDAILGVTLAPADPEKNTDKRAASVRTSLHCFGARRGCVRCSLLRLSDGEGLRKGDGDITVHPNEVNQCPGRVGTRTANHVQSGRSTNCCGLMRHKCLLRCTRGEQGSEGLGGGKRRSTSVLLVRPGTRPNRL